METQAREEFAAQLNAARLDQHLSIGTLARMVGAPKATVQGWLNGRHLPTPALRSHYLKLVDVLGMGEMMPEDLWLTGWRAIEPRLRAGESPYLGLRTFGVDDVDYFFGRGAEAGRVAEAVLSLRQAAGHGVVAVVGPSGSGKSSLLAAGVVAGECVDGRLGDLSVCWASPEKLKAGPLPTADLVVIDQLEEILLRPLGDDRTAVLESIAKLAESCTVLVAIRSDAFAAASAEPALVNALARPILVSSLTPDELRDVIVGPARLSGVSVDEDLVHVLLHDMVPGSAQPAAAADLLPLLSNALLVTWAAGSGTRMTLADYREAGGLGGAIETLAEQVYAGLGENEKDVARGIFLRLVGVTDAAVTARPIARADLGPGADPVVDAFVAARMLTLSGGDLRVSHEALVRHWSRLAGWISDYRSDLDALAKLRRAARVWEDADRDPGVLIPTQRLALYTEWLDDPQRTALLGSEERGYLAASEQHYASVLDEERRRSGRLRRQRQFALVLAVITTIAAVTAGISFARGEGYRAEAEVARSGAESRQAAIAARSLRSKSPNLVGQMALVSAALANTQEARAVVMDAQAMDVPLRRTGAPTAVLATSPDGTVIVRADGAGTVTLWHGSQLQTSPGTVVPVDSEGGPLLAVALAETQGRLVMAVGGPNVRSLWDVTEEPRHLADLDSPSAVSAVTFNPSGDKVVFGDASGGITVYGLDDPLRPLTLASMTLHEPNPPLQVSSLALDDHGRLYVGGLVGQIDRWQLGARPEPLPKLATMVTDSQGHETPVRVQALALTRDGKYLAAGAASTHVFRWSVPESGEPVSQPGLASFSSWINALAFAADGATLGVASSDQTISLYDANGAELRRMTTPAIQTGVGFLKDGSPVSVGTDGTLLAWQPQSPLWKASGAPVYNLATDGSRWLAAGGSTDGISLWRLGPEAQRMPAPVVPTLPAGDVQRGAVGVAPNGKFLVGATLQGRILTWPLADDGAAEGSVFETGGANIITYTTVSPDSTMVAAMEYGGNNVVIFRAEERGALTEVSTIEGKTPQLVGFSGDGTLLAIAQTDNSVAFWSLADPTAPTLAGSITGLATMPSTFSLAPGSNRIAIGESSGEVSIWEIVDPSKPVKERSWHDPASAMYSLAFSADEALLVGTSGDDLVWGWNLNSESVEAEFALSGDVGRPWDVRFFDNGERFAVSGSTGAVRVWQATPVQASTELCRGLGTPLTPEEWRRYLPGITPRTVC